MSMVIMLTAGWISVSAQNTLQISSGPSWLARQDLLFSPLIAKDLGIPAIQIEYERTGKWVHHARVGYRGFAISPVKNFQFWRSDTSEPLQTLPHYFTFIDLAYGLGKKVAGNERNAFSLGASLSSQVDALNFNYGGSGAFGYFASFSLETWAEGRWQVAKRHSINAKLQLPLISWIARSPYLLNDDTFIENTASHNGVKTFLAFIGDGHLQTWNRFQKAAWSIEHQMALSERWAIGWAYRGELFRHTRPLAVTSLQQDIAIIIQYKF